MNIPKELMFSHDVRKKLSDGISKIAQSIRHTLGPKCRFTGFEKEKGEGYTITSDGGYILKDMVLPDQFENMGAGLAIEVAVNIKEQHGDGVTTSIILMDAAVQEGLQMIQAGFQPVILQKGINKGIELVIQYLKKISISAQRDNVIEKVAFTSSGGNAELAKIVMSAFEQVDEKGFVSVETGRQRETVVEIINGLRIPTTRLNLSYLSSNETSGTIENAYILLSDRVINSIHELLPILQILSQENHPLVIICKSISHDVLASLAANSIQGHIKVAVISIKVLEQLSKGWLYDVTIFSGGVPLTEETGHDLRKISKAHLGFCKKIIIGENNSTFIGGKGSKTACESRCLHMDIIANKRNKVADKDSFKKRQAMLQSQVALIKIGADSDLEFRYKKILCKDCVNAVKSALSNGVLPGGGIALLRAASLLESKLPSDAAERAGMNIVIQACKAPFLQLLSTHEQRGCIQREILEDTNPFVGFNLVSEKIENLYEHGILDPTRIVLEVFEKALSSTATILLTEVAIGDADIP
ncbi:60 kDa chaperonin 3 [Candidatus Clavichlamydia salmonicola]|uniref:chaperonin GroEL n=1 Tax=Candidatus Clavichlamydia salmonicola TaxID=469812 RepID=UPI001890C4D7|nr:chaperonin GroEL [Candidatus Clavichlamydia salmonicola]MBF5050501.1 60 kDa chaperonin 3 [Candidatus Clavichlamydia salmonicola]